MPTTMLSPSLCPQASLLASTILDTMFLAQRHLYTRGVSQHDLILLSGRYIQTLLLDLCAWCTRSPQRLLTAPVQFRIARTHIQSAALSLLWPCHFLQNAARPLRPKAHKPAPTTRTSGPRSPEQAASPLGHKLASLATSKSSMFFSRNSS